jgi:hypothetical protein
VEVFFELLRFKDGDFVFDSDVVTDIKGTTAEIEATLDEAEKMLDEWKTIEVVVPSLSSWVELVPELEVDEITVDRARWRVLVAIGAGVTVGELGDRLELGELLVSRQVKELVDARLASVGEAPAGREAHQRFEAQTAPVVEAPEPVFDTPSADTVELIEETVTEPEPSLHLASNGSNGSDVFDTDTLVREPEPVVSEPAPEPAPTVSFEPDPSDAAEIARQLANLSPKAAKAVAAAAKATTVEEREAALAEVDDQEDPINRELLIKFLGSVNS